MGVPWILGSTVSGSIPDGSDEWQSGSQAVIALLPKTFSSMGISGFVSLPAPKFRVKSDCWRPRGFRLGDWSGSVLRQWTARNGADHRSDATGLPALQWKHRIAHSSGW